tara:strand:+ start:1383 stop:1583 length:201 start_codon:yes stop_codon:yes gene_type:complete
MLKTPQNIIKISSQDDEGKYFQMVFDAEDMGHEELVERFQNFLRGIGYIIPYDNLLNCRMFAGKDN